MELRQRVVVRSQRRTRLPVPGRACIVSLHFARVADAAHCPLQLFVLVQKVSNKCSVIEELA